MFLPCRPCCGEPGCEVADGKPRTDPVTEGTWVPSGDWDTLATTWTFVPNTSGSGGETWFFYGSAATSKQGGGATAIEQTDFNNICNWYSSKTTEPSDTFDLVDELDKRATSLPNSSSVIHFYSIVNPASLPAGGLFVKTAFFWRIPFAGTITGTTAPLGPNSCSVIFWNSNPSSLTSVGTVNGGALFLNGRNNGTVNDGGVFLNAAFNKGTVNGGALFNGFFSVVAANEPDGIINGGAEFFGDAGNRGGTVNGGGDFYNRGGNILSISPPGLSGVVNDGAAFFNSTRNECVVNGGAEFYDSSENRANGTVNGGAVFNDNACSRRFTGVVGPPCTKVFVAHPTDLPTCNGTAPAACANPSATCGCG